MIDHRSYTHNLSRPFRPEFFSGFNFTTAYFTKMIFFFYHMGSERAEKERSLQLNHPRPTPEDRRELFHFA